MTTLTRRLQHFGDRFTIPTFDSISRSMRGNRNDGRYQRHAEAHGPARDSVREAVPVGKVLNQGAAYTGGESMTPLIDAAERTQAELTALLIRVSAASPAAGRFETPEAIGTVLDLGNQFLGAMRSLQKSLDAEGEGERREQVHQEREAFKTAVASEGGEVTEGGQRMQVGDTHRNPGLMGSRFAGDGSAGKALTPEDLNRLHSEHWARQPSPFTIDASGKATHDRNQEKLAVIAQAGLRLTGKA